MSRIFTFGCSFTQFAWPTWADIIAYDKETEYHNYAVAGLGNVGIFHRLVEADMKHKFTDSDEIYILWSSWSREDRIKNAQWAAAGSVLHFHDDHNNIYDKQFVKKYWDIDNDIVKNSTAIISANKMYKHLIKWQASGFDMFTNEEESVTLNLRSKYISSLYKESIPEMRLLRCETSKPFNKVHDSHPDVLGHLNIVKIIYEDLDIVLKGSTIEEFLNLQKDIEEIVEKTNITTFSVIVKHIEILIKNKYNNIYKITNFKSLVEN